MTATSAFCTCRHASGLRAATVTTTARTPSTTAPRTPSRLTRPPHIANFLPALSRPPGKSPSPDIARENPEIPPSALTTLLFGPCRAHSRRQSLLPLHCRGAHPPLAPLARPTPRALSPTQRQIVHPRRSGGIFSDSMGALEVRFHWGNQQQPTATNSNEHGPSHQPAPETRRGPGHSPANATVLVSHSRHPNRDRAGGWDRDLPSCTLASAR